MKPRAVCLAGYGWLLLLLLLLCCREPIAKDLQQQQQEEEEEEQGNSTASGTVAGSMTCAETMIPKQHIPFLTG